MECQWIFIMTLVYNFPMIKTNWHTHTARCGHAIGTDEEYVTAAIQAGVKTLGFSDHAPYREPFPPERMNYEQLDEYCDSVLTLKEKYKDQISIHLGMELECYQSEWDDLMAYRKRMDYCILGQHQITFNGLSSYSLYTGNELMQYADQIEYACRHGLCDYIAHPDVCMWSYPVIDESVRTIASRIAEISAAYDVPLEINCGSGVRSGMKEYDDGLRYAYPVRIFFEEAAKHNCRTVLGLDIHDPQLFFTDEYINRALSVVEGLDLNIVEDLDLVSEAAARKKKIFG